MATYYINGYNSAASQPFDGTPYTEGNDGAPNFNTLLTDLNGVLKDGDSVVVYDGDFIDDTANTIELYTQLNISTVSGKDIPVHLINNTGLVPVVTCSVSNTHFHVANYTGAPFIYVYSSGTKIDGCSFTHDPTTASGTVIQVPSVDGVDITNNTIDVPEGTPYSQGILVVDSKHSNIIGNTIDMGLGGGIGINCVGPVAYTTISHNIIGAGVGNGGIKLDNVGSYNTVSHNAIAVSGPNSVGIQYSMLPDAIGTTSISNNFISLGEDDSDNIGIKCIANISNTEVYTEVINNIIFYNTNLGTSNGIAIVASISKGMVDYNNIYGFGVGSIFETDGNPVNIGLGNKNIFTDPNLVFWTVTPTPFELGDIRLYYCNTNSECLGAGMGHHNIGVGVYNLADNDEYLNIVDTVTDDIGKIVTDNVDLAPTFFNNVLSEEPSDFNSWYRKNNGPYKSDDVYKNQWEFEHVNPDTFPFEKDDHFYRESFTYILQHKGDLAPFEGITCPANPGYGYDAYPGYETGLWGYPRASYKNNCFPDPCVIQDTYDLEKIQLDDTIQDVEFWIYDKIIPECLEGEEEDPSTDDGCGGE